MKKLLLFTLLCLGCGKPETDLEKQTRLNKFAASDLPNGATVIEELGNNWIYFELRIGQKTRKFLFRRVGGYSNYATETITELHD